MPGRLIGGDVGAGVGDAGGVSGRLKALVLGLSFLRSFLFGFLARGFLGGFGPLAFMAFEIVIGFAGHISSFRKSGHDGASPDAPVS